MGRRKGKGKVWCPVKTVETHGEMKIILHHVDSMASPCCGRAESQQHQVESPGGAQYRRLRVKAAVQLKAVPSTSSAMSVLSPGGTKEEEKRQESWRESALRLELSRVPE